MGLDYAACIAVYYAGQDINISSQLGPALLTNHQHPTNCAAGAPMSLQMGPFRSLLSVAAKALNGHYS